MGGKAYGRSDSQAGGASVQNFSESSGKPLRAVAARHGRPPALFDQVPLRPGGAALARGEPRRRSGVCPLLLMGANVPSVAAPGQ
jgi:hypothetical protein